ncbi:MAG: EAL domain-containing protein, partial [Kamptonema sp. SIO4C4]|nr:EAL domain-containing protein [Kamptonema sp. SIO4C4]
AWLLIPLFVDGQIWGSFTLNTRQSSYTWTEDKVQLAQAVADQLEVAIQQAELYQQVQQEKQKLLESQTVLSQAQQIANMGNWEIEVETQKMSWSDNLFRIFGLNPNEIELDLDQVLRNHVHPEDQSRLEELLNQAMTQGTSYEIDLRIMKADGSIGYMEARAEAIRDQQGQIIKICGIALDISDRKATELALRESETRYRQVVETQTDFILRSRPDTTITFANETLCHVLGLTLEDMVGRKWSDFANPDDLRENAFGKLKHLTPSNPRCIVENRDNRAEGKVGWTQWINEGVFDESGQLVEIQSVGRDITELKAVEQALRDSEERLRLVTENMSDLVCLHHPDGRYLYVTPSSETLLGYPPEELIGRDPYDFFHPEDRDRIRRESHNALLQGNSNPDNNQPITYRARRKNGDYIWLETLARGILDEQGKVIHIQTTSRYVSDRIKVEQQLKHDALHDGLTGLPNRHFLMERLNTALEQVQESSPSQFAVLFLDLDHFKVVNDSLGHFIGDQLLVVMARLLSQFIGETDMAARLGGDEFIILLEEVEDEATAIQLAERILELLRSPLQLGEREVFTSTSIGIVFNQPNHQRAEDVLRDADLAMYRAKHSGRGRYTLFDPTMHLQVVQRLHLENDLRKALQNQEFVLYYQPIVYLENQSIRGFEALIRWQHPQRGLITPGEFIGVAEETGLIVPMGQWILQAACQQLAAWQTQFLEKPLKISINLSVRQLQSGLLQQLDEVLTTYQVSGENLVLEITESMLVQNIEVTCDLLSQIQAKGINLSIDDFGTGYSSLSYLRQLPVDDLKIDRAFVSPQESDARNQVIAESIIALSNLLELNAIAEGIETPQQLAWLQSLGCELGQGYLFSRPVAVEEATALLQQRVFTV